MSLVGCVYIKFKNSLTINRQKSDITPTTTLLSPITTPTLTPKYSVTIVRRPVPSSHGFSFEAIVKNISIYPYITNFAFYECDFLDKTNRTHKGELMDEKLLSKAILPGESATIIFNDVNTSIKNLERRDYSVASETWYECAYDEKGQNFCKNIEGMRITNCTAYTSSTKKQASNGWGENPLKVNFP